MPRLTAPPAPRSIVLLSLLLPLVLVVVTSCGRSMSTSVAPRRELAAAALIGGGLGTDDEVLVTLVAGIDAQQIAAAHGARLVELDASQRMASLLPQAGQTALELQQILAADPGVFTAEPNGWLETAETRQQSFAFDDGYGTPRSYTEQPAADAIHLGQAHEVALGDGVIVAILDTGIDPRHPALRFAYAGGIDLVDGDSDPSEVRDGIDNDADASIDEGFGHGTHVAGIIHLVAPGAKLLAVRVLDSDGRGRLFDVANGVRWAVDHGAKIINLSLGSLEHSDALQQALEAAQDRGVVVISSAGNWGAESPVEFPARSSHVAAIAAVDAAAVPAPFSSYGHIIALAAPGVGVRSTFPGGGYRLWSGTSMSAPFVAGTCALLAESHPDWNLDLMLEQLSRTARYVLAGEEEFGAGALDAGAALEPDRRVRIDDVPVAEELRPR